MPRVDIKKKKISTPRSRYNRRRLLKRTARKKREGWSLSTHLLPVVYL
jgi:hypothetical protein